MFRTGVRKADYDTYRQTWDQLLKLNDLREMDIFGESICSGATGFNVSKWVEEIEARKEPHASGELPGDPEAAWTHRVWEQVLEGQSANRSRSTAKQLE